MNDLLPRPWKLTPEPGRCGKETRLAKSLKEPGSVDEIIERDFDKGKAFFPGTKDSQKIAEDTERAFREIVGEKNMEQSYSLVIRPDGSAIAAGDRAGLFYGLSTLQQLFEPDGSLPCVTILDRPALAYRGFLQDLSRGQVLSPSGMRRLVQALAAFRYNFLTFNIEHTFSFKSHPEIGAGHDPLTREELAELLAFAKARGIEIIPSQQSLGHMRGILSLPEYRHLAYDEKLCWSIDPGKDETYKLLRDLYEDIIPCYGSRFFNVCCDEPFDLKARFDESRFNGRSFVQVYFDHLMRLKEILDEHGKKIMLWGDMLISHPEILGWLPDDVIVLNWQYGSGLKEGPEYYREKIRPIQSAGKNFLTCTCTWNLTKIFTNLDVMQANNKNFIQEGIASGSLGNILTNWGDMGHMNLLGMQAYPIAYAAQIMWTGEPLEAKEFDMAFSSAFFNDRTAKPAALMRKLQEANSIIPGPEVFGDIAFQIFFDETLAGDFMLTCLPEGSGGPAKDMPAELAKKVNEAQSLLDEILSSGIIRKEWLEDIRISIQQFRIISLKVKIFCEGKTRIKSPEGLSDMSQDFIRLSEMTEDAAFALEQRWLSQAKPSDLKGNLDRFRRLSEVYLKRSDQFKDLAKRLKRGEKIPEWKEIARSPEFIPHKFDLIKEMGLKDLL